MAKLLSDPFLQLPTEDSIRVVWFTEFLGKQHTVTYGENLDQTAIATTTKLTRSREDHQSRVGKQTVDGQIYQKPINRDIWRHEACLSWLVADIRIPYRVTSVDNNGESVSSNIFTAAIAPSVNKPLKILFTSDHQLKPMVAANLQKAAETIGIADAVLFAGDLITTPDRASDWFDDNRGGAFFPCLQGHGHYQIENNGVKIIYSGGEIIQHAPMFTCIGNHEIMGRYERMPSLDGEFDDTIPRDIAKKIYGEDSLKNNSFNTDTYEEIFTLPESKEGGKTYYAVTFGNIRLVVLYATNMWRFITSNKRHKGKYDEPEANLNSPEDWGYGQHIYEPISKDSTQYNWLKNELNSPEFKQAKYKIVMLHHPPHSLGGNIVPAYTDPVQIIEKDSQGKITAVRYEYPKEKDYIVRDLMPLLEEAKVQLVLYGHSHLWNRFITSGGIHCLETSNVGNSYGAYINNNKRLIPNGYSSEYVELGNPNQLQPITPTIAPLLGEDGKPQPYIASNELTVFSIFETATGTISSYYFNTLKPDSEVIKFDEFKLIA
jgi:Calcineurin-like phosphoesterase